MFKENLSKFYFLKINSDKQSLLAKLDGGNLKLASSD